MSVSYDIFTSMFLDKIEEYKFIKLPEENRTQIVDGYMKRACAQFKKICKHNIATGDDDAREFPIDIPDEDIDEIADIISEGMLVQWMKHGKNFFRTGGNRHFHVGVNGVILENGGNREHIEHRGVCA